MQFWTFNCNNCNTTSLHFSEHMVSSSIQFNIYLQYQLASALSLSTAKSCLMNWYSTSTKASITSWTILSHLKPDPPLFPAPPHGTLQHLDHFPRASTGTCLTVVSPWSHCGLTVVSPWSHRGLTVYWEIDHNHIQQSKNCICQAKFPNFTYMNDLPEAWKNIHIQVYVDDDAICASAKNTEEAACHSHARAIPYLGLRTVCMIISKQPDKVRQVNVF